MSETTDAGQEDQPTIGLPETIIPDQSVVESRLSWESQQVSINYSELQSYFDWMKQQAATMRGEELVREGVNVVTNNLKPGEEVWDRIRDAGEDANYTLGRCIKEGVNTCFQRAVFFNLLMQQVGILAQTVQGDWYESERVDMKIPADNPAGIAVREGGQVFHIGEGDRTGSHLWNLVELGPKHYLVDTAYLAEKEGKTQPVLQEINYEPGKKDFSISLGSGETRHYLAEGPVKVTTIA